MTKYLVAVEHPTGFDEENITVTNDVEGFGPSLLAAYPIQTMEADSPAGAAYCYAKRHSLTNMLIAINLPDNNETWWMCIVEAHKIDHREGPIWEPLEPEAITIKMSPDKLETCVYFARRLRVLGDETDIVEWFELSEIDKERDNAYWVLGSILAEILEDAGLMPPEAKGKRTSTTGAGKIMHMVERERRMQSHDP